MIWSYNARYDWSWWMLYVLFSHFRPRDGKFRPMREHPRVYVCRFNLKVYIGKVTRSVILWGYHPTLKLSGIPTFTLIVSLTYSMDNIEINLQYSIKFLAIGIYMSRGYSATPLWGLSRNSADAGIFSWKFLGYI